MKKKSFSIALSALSCALATIFMAIGINVPFAFVTGYLFGTVSMMLPLGKDFRWGAFLAYIAASLLCLAFGGIGQFYKLFPFIAFFGLHPLVNSLQGKYHVNRWVAFAVKAVWFDGAMCGAWAIFDAMTEVSLPFAWMYDWAYLLIVIGGTVVFFFYDWLMLRCQRMVNWYVARVDRRGGQKPKAPPPAGEQEDIFGMDAPAPSAPDGPEESGGEEQREKTEEGKETGTEPDGQAERDSGELR